MWRRRRTRHICRIVAVLAECVAEIYVNLSPGIGVLRQRRESRTAKESEDNHKRILIFGGRQERRQSREVAAPRPAAQGSFVITGPGDCSYAGPVYAGNGRSMSGS